MKNETHEAKIQKCAEEIGVLVDQTCASDSDFADVIRKHLPAPGASLEAELAEALRELMKCQSAADRAHSVSVRSVIEDCEAKLSEAHAECDSLIRRYDAAKQPDDGIPYAPID